MGPNFDVFPIMAAIWFGGIALICFGIWVYKTFYYHNCTPVCGKQLSRLQVISGILKDNGVTDSELSALQKHCYGELHRYSADEMLHPESVTDYHTIDITYCPGCKKIVDPRIDLAKEIQDKLALIRDANRRVEYYEDAVKLLAENLKVSKP